MRWWIYAYMFGFAAVAYLQRISVSVAGPDIMHSLQLSTQELGWLFLAFTTAYALAQLPGGALGQRFGPRIVFTGVGLLGIVGMLGTALPPWFLAGGALLIALIVAQCVLGVGQGPVFPVFAAVVERWFPARQFALTNGVISSGMLLGGAVTPPLIVALTAMFGWQWALLTITVPAALLTAGWWWYGRDRPDQHARVCPEELAELDTAPPAPPLTLARMWQVLRNRDILLLTASYLCMNFVFYMISYWSFLYLVEQRQLTGLESGLMAMVPWIGAAAGAAVGGVLGDWCAVRLGPTRGYRLLPLISLPIGAVMLVATPAVDSVAVAVAALTVAFFAMEVNEGPYWAATMSVARADTGAATGVLNTGGNVGGMMCQPVVAALAAQGAWTAAWASGAAFALLAAFLWLFVKAVPASANTADAPFRFRKTSITSEAER